MQKYVLFAARDGDVIRDDSVQDDDEAAELWAAQRIGDEFNLSEIARNDFYEALAECDGVSLERDSTQILDDVVVTWAVSQLSFLEKVDKCYGGLPSRERNECKGALMELAAALRR